tara:strand:- start:616 stop:837 length:222 start_codon:yes stop_codon:yes gene_type:complete
METTEDKIVLLDYSNGDVVILENVPTQKYIDEHYYGDWEDWLYTIQKEREDIPRIKDCHWMHTTNYGIETIKL